MPHTPTDRAPLRVARAQAPTLTLTRKISTLRPLPNDGRAQQVTDVVDAFRRLRGSVIRFVRVFSVATDETLSALSLRELLATLESDARAARFTRLSDLERAIGQARALERTRDDVFSDAFSNDPAAMRDAAAALERVDVLLVGLCVEHVIERHTPASRPESAALC
ncbi:hypothetical protein [Burkholderia catarinensis]|uniref:hypothetical protein n=1 Tax=Burkholderia catarinensis TaxID=1108140 RepID=UPI00091CCA70|nr:hypothetical protein [Burkholderia catarinensis]KAG8149982.1 hypothetical protein BFF94_029470 [Burkholderia catarinensis]